MREGESEEVRVRVRDMRRYKEREGERGVYIIIRGGGGGGGGERRGRK